MLVDDPLADVYAPPLLPRRLPAGLPAGGHVHLQPSRRSTRCCSSTRPTARRTTSPPTSTGGPARPSSPPTARRSTSSPTTTAGTRSSGCPWPAGSRCASPPTARTATCRSPATAAPSTPCARGTTPRRCRSASTRRPRCRSRRSCRTRAPSTPCPAPSHEVEATASDGARVQSWLVLPEGASAENPAPLLLWIHGGPLMSWNSWSWRWCPWLMAARGYAVLMPNPALSQGFGQDFVRRGWGEWGGAPYTDLMAAVDAAEQRDDIDASRTAAMGGSFGGYMANWVATQTDRFKAIVTHASLWDLDAFTGTTDAAYYWEKEWGDPLTEPKRYEQNSPHRYADAIRTPMLVIHGDKDYRVPIGEALRLWYDLQKRAVPSKFLYFPDENHWVLTPGNAHGLVRGGVRVPGRARAGRGVAAARAALTRRRARQAPGRASSAAPPTMIERSWSGARRRSAPAGAGRRAGTSGRPRAPAPGPPRPWRRPRGAMPRPRAAWPGRRRTAAVPGGRTRSTASRRPGPRRGPAAARGRAPRCRAGPTGSGPAPGPTAPSRPGRAPARPGPPSTTPPPSRRRRVPATGRPPPRPPAGPRRPCLPARGAIRAASSSRLSATTTPAATDATASSLVPSGSGVPRSGRQQADGQS